MIPERIQETVRACARGSYQTGLLDGSETWSGSSLKGEAKKWGGRYARSRGSLVARIASNLPPGWSARTGLVVINARRRRVLLLIAPPDTVNLQGAAHVWGTW